MNGNPFHPTISGYPRDLRGYGRHRPNPAWPGGAALAVQFVLNYEEGGEHSVLHGDAHAESFLAEHFTGPPRAGRHASIEGIFEYGSRVGFWRLWRLFSTRAIPLTVFGVTMALARHPEAVAAMQEEGWEIASHGLRWIDHSTLTEADERRYLIDTMALHRTVCGAAPEGWYLGRASPNSLRLLTELTQPLYLSDFYNDELPYWRVIGAAPQLVLPYTLDANDMRFLTAPGFGDGENFARYLIDSFDVLLAEGQRGSPGLMSIGLHPRITGRPGRLAGLARFLDHVAGHPQVWLARRDQVARHWRERFPYRAP